MRRLIALALIFSPALSAPAFADGIERPRPRHARPAPRPAPVHELAGGPIEIPVEAGPETVSLNDGFLRGADGGVGATVHAAALAGGGSRIVIQGGRSTAVAIAMASASASASAGGFSVGGGCR